MLLLRSIDFIKEIDSRLFLLINGFHNSFFDVFMHYASNKFTWIPLYIFFLFGVIKNYGKHTILILIFILITIALSDQVCLHLFKNIFLRYRPCHNLKILSQIHLVDECGGLYGFVSSHASNTFALAFFLFVLFKEKYKWSFLLFVWAAFVSYSRIYLGQHYPADVFAGVMVGITSAWLVSKLYFYTKRKLGYV